MREVLQRLVRAVTGNVAMDGSRNTNDWIDDLRRQFALADNLRGNRVTKFRRTGNFLPVGAIGTHLAGI